MMQMAKKIMAIITVGMILMLFLRNVNEEEQVALWREGRRREPMPVEIDF